MPAKRDDRTDRPEGDIVTPAHIVLRLRRSGAIMPAQRDNRTDRPEGDIVTLAHIVLRLRRSGAIVPALTAGHNRTLRRCADKSQSAKHGIPAAVSRRDRGFCLHFSGECGKMKKKEGRRGPCCRSCSAKR